MSRLFLLALMIALVGCGGEKQLSPEETKAAQTQSEQKANDEEREYQKQQAAQAKDKGKDTSKDAGKAKESAPAETKKN